MDESKRKYCKVAEEVEEKRKKVTQKAIAFIERGQWSGEKVKLNAKEWDEVMRYFLLRAGDVFEYISGFSPIEHLINWDLKDRNSSFITDVSRVKFSEGVDLKTHCRELGKISVDKVEKTEDKRYEKNKVLLITRKTDFIVWDQELDITTRSDLYRIISVSTEFKFVKEIPAEFFEPNGISVQSMLDRVYLWLNSDMEKRKKQLEYEEKIYKLAGFMRDNVGQIIHAVG